MSERDSHFAGFAKLLLDELLGGSGLDYVEITEPYEDVRTLIARRAYDLVFHTFMKLDTYWLDALDSAEWVERIPDMTALPPEETG